MNNRPQVTTVFFDFGRVLGLFDHLKACIWLASQCSYTQEEIRTKYFGTDAETLRITGALSGREFYEIVRQDLSLPRTVTYGWFAKMWGDIFTSAPYVVLDALERVRPAVACVLTPNAEELHWPYIERLYTVGRIFPPAKRMLSFKMGVRKPDSRYFELALARVGARAEEVLYIDDIPAYVEVFRNMGGQGEVFDLTKEDPNRLLSILKEYGVVD